MQADPSLCTSSIVDFAMHRLMCDMFVQTITLSTRSKIFNRRQFEIFFSFFQENRICISCKLSPLSEMSNPVFLVIKKITNLLSAELAQIVVIQKLRVRYPWAPSVMSLSKTFYPRNFYPRRLYIMDKYHFEDALPPMLGLYMRLFYSLNKLRFGFCRERERSDAAFYHLDMT